MEQGKPGENRENHQGNSPGISPKGRVISYNVSEGERPGGIKVRFKIRIATGKRAQRNRRAPGEGNHGGTPMATPAKATIMTPAATGGGAPAEPVPVAFLGRTSTLEMQDPRASLRRQLRVLPGLAAARAGSSPPSTGTSSPAAWTWRPAPRARPTGPFTDAGHPPRRRHGRPARRGRQPGPEIRRGHLRGHRTLRPGHLQRAEAGKETVPQRDPAVRHRRARPSSTASTPPPCWSGG